MGQLPVFFINLRNRPDRRTFMEQQFAKLGIAAERIEALTPGDLSPTERAAALSPEQPWAISPLTLACALSHRRAWQTMRAQRHSSALILEDDVVMHPSIDGFLRPDVLGTMGVGLLHLETGRRPVRLGSRPMGSIDGVPVRPILTSHPGAGAYILNARIADASIADPAAVTMEVDRYLFGRGGRWLTEIDIGQALVAPCIQLVHLEQQAGTTLASSSIGKSELPRRSPEGRARRRALNMRYMRHLAGALLSDPTALVSRPAPIAFAGDG
jgi:hypothetical protein